MELYLYANYMFLQNSRYNVMGWFSNPVINIVFHAT